MPINCNNNHVTSSKFLKPENMKPRCLCSLIFELRSRRQRFVSLAPSHPVSKYIPNAMEVTEQQILFLKVTTYQLIQPLQGETDETHCLREMTTNIHWDSPSPIGFLSELRKPTDPKWFLPSSLNWTWGRVPIKMEQIASNTQDFPCYTLSSDTDSWLNMKKTWETKDNKRYETNY